MQTYGKPEYDISFREPVICSISSKLQRPMPEQGKSDNRGSGKYVPSHYRGSGAVEGGKSD